MQQHVRLAQLDRAFGYGPKGRGFESSNARCFVRLCTLFCAFVLVLCVEHTNFKMQEALSRDSCVFRFR